MQLSSSVANAGKQLRCLLKYNTRVSEKVDHKGVMIVMNLINTHESNNTNNELCEQ